MKKKALILLVVIGAFCLSGCKRIEIDDSVEDAYIEYAVNAVINHDKNNMLKMERVEIETEEETQWISDDDIQSGNDSSSNEDDVVTQMSYVSFEEALGNDALSVKVKGIKECASYPESDGENLTFAITATTGSRLVVIELDLTNISGQDVSLDTTKGYSFKGIVNGVVRTNALRAFDYALNGNVHTIEAGKTKSTVLVYELNNERVTDINKIVVSVDRNNKAYNVSVK